MPYADTHYGRERNKIKTLENSRSILENMHFMAEEMHCVWYMKNRYIKKPLLFISLFVLINCCGDGNGFNCFSNERFIQEALEAVD